jgi:uncharacterized membrane protein YebE (DUF533 family)
MKIERPNARELTPEETQELEKLRARIERATADGKVTNEEYQVIKEAIAADKKVTGQELELVRTLIAEKLRQGELEEEWE